MSHTGSLLVLLLAACHAAGVQLPTKTFFERPEVSSLVISPNGEMAMAINAHGIAIVDLDTMKRIGGFNYQEANKVVGSVYWLTDERIMFEPVANIGGGDERPYITGEYFAMNVDGRRSIRLFGGEDRRTYHRLIDLLRHDPDHILVQGQTVDMGVNGRPTAYLKNIHRKSTNRSSRKPIGGPSPLPFGSLHADNAGQVRLAVGRNFESVSTVVMYRDDMQSDWIDITTTLGGDWDDSVLPVGASADNDAFYFLSRLGGDTRALHRFDAATRSSELVYRDPQVDIGAADLWWNSSHTRPVGATLEKAFPEPVVLDPEADTARIYATIIKAFKGSRVEITSQSEDGTAAIVRVSSDRNPGDYYHYDRTANKLTPLGVGVRDRIEPEAMAPVHPIAVAARDGVEITGYITMPNGPGHHPLVVMPHGGPFGVRETWRFDNEAQFLANRGFAVLQVNFRGSGGRGRAFERAGYRQWGGTMIDDVVDATRWVAAGDDIDAKRMCIFGASYGGYAALTAVIREPDLFRCAVGFVGVYDLELMHERGDVRASSAGRGYLAEVIGRDRESLRAESPVHNAHRIKVPVMLAHGTEDRRVPIKHAHAMRDALAKAEVPYEWFVEHGEGHGFYSEENQSALYDAVVDFISTSMASATTRGE